MRKCFGFRRTIVGDLDLVVEQQNVLGFDVAVKNTVAMHVIHSLPAHAVKAVSEKHTKRRNGTLVKKVRRGRERHG
jgi:hypothetical protein